MPITRGIDKLIMRNIRSGVKRGGHREMIFKRATVVNIRRPCVRGGSRWLTLSTRRGTMATGCARLLENPQPALAPPASIWTAIWSLINTAQITALKGRTNRKPARSLSTVLKQRSAHPPHLDCHTPTKALLLDIVNLFESR